MIYKKMFPALRAFLRCLFCVSIMDISRLFPLICNQYFLPFIDNRTYIVFLFLAERAICFHWLFPLFIIVYTISQGAYFVLVGLCTTPMPNLVFPHSSHFMVGITLSWKFLSSYPLFFHHKPTIFTFISCPKIPSLLVRYFFNFHNLSPFLL